VQKGKFTKLGYTVSDKWTMDVKEIRKGE